MLVEIIILVVSILIGIPVVGVGGSVSIRLIKHMDAISVWSAWLGRIAMAAGAFCSILIGAALIVSGNGFFAPLAGLSAAAVLELVVASQIRNGIKVWERRERAKASPGLPSIVTQIEERLSMPNLAKAERLVLSVQRLILRSVGLVPGP